MSVTYSLLYPKSALLHTFLAIFACTTTGIIKGGDAARMNVKWKMSVEPQPHLAAKAPKWPLGGRFEHFLLAYHQKKQSIFSSLSSQSVVCASRVILWSSLELKWIQEAHQSLLDPVGFLILFAVPRSLLMAQRQHFGCRWVTGSLVEYKSLSLSEIPTLFLLKVLLKLLLWINTYPVRNPWEDGIGEIITDFKHRISVFVLEY